MVATNDHYKHTILATYFKLTAIIEYLMDVPLHEIYLQMPAYI